MKTLLALGFASACLALASCGGDDNNSVKTLDSKDVRPPAAEPVPEPGSGIKLGSDKSGGGAGAPKKPAGN